MLARNDHGVLCTLHPERGIDAVPCLYAVDDDGYVGFGIDRVKPKLSTSLQRTHNLDRDPRATLLLEGWDREDWSKLWWVRAHLVHVPEEAHRGEVIADRLAARFPQYADKPFERIVVLRVAAITGWSGAEG